MIWTIGFFCLLALAVFLIARAAKRAGPRQIAEADLARARVLLAVSASDAGAAWSKLGSRTSSRGLGLKFDHDDDPEAEATLLAPGVEQTRTNALANKLTVRLGGEFETFHVHTGGYVFRVCLRGTGAVIGKQTEIQMVVDGRGNPHAVRIENDDDMADPAVGDWIEIRRVEILEMAGART